MSFFFRQILFQNQFLFVPEYCTWALTYIPNVNSARSSWFSSLFLHWYHNWIVTITDFQWFLSSQIFQCFNSNVTWPNLCPILWILVNLFVSWLHSFMVLWPQSLTIPYSVIRYLKVLCHFESPSVSLNYK